MQKQNLKKALSRFVLPFFIVCAPCFSAYILTKNAFLCAVSIMVALCAFVVYIKRWHCVDFDSSSAVQRRLFVFVAVLLSLLSYFLCAVSMEGELLLEYPLKGSVDDYGCYVQTFDAFQKGRLDIDTEYDLSVLESLENPYDYSARKDATGEKYGVFWDRAFYNGKLYSYFGVAPIILLYYPVFFLTGKVLSDSLAAALLSEIFCCLAVALVFLLCKRMEKKPPLLLALVFAAALPFGSLVFPTLTNANFYHIAVLSGMTFVMAFFVSFLCATETPDGIKRKIIFALSGFSVAAIVASRPNMVLYVLIAIPFMFSVIKKCEYGKKSLIGDISAFSVPMLVGGVLIMLYNNARFGSPFDFGTAYQLTVTDTSRYSFELSMLVPSIYHYLLQRPSLNDIFPYLHMTNVRLADYGTDGGYVYLARSIGAVIFPSSWGCLLLPVMSEQKTKLRTGIAAIAVAMFVAYFDMCFAGVHLRYVTDIMFVLTAVGIYSIMFCVCETKKGSNARIIAFSLAVAVVFATVLVSLPMIFDNERLSIMRNSPDFFLFMANRTVSS